VELEWKRIRLATEFGSRELELPALARMTGDSFHSNLSLEVSPAAGFKTWLVDCRAAGGLPGTPSGRGRPVNQGGLYVVMYCQPGAAPPRSWSSLDGRGDIWCMRV